MRRLNIRWRLTLWFGAAMTALLVVRSFWIYFMMERRLTATTDIELNLELAALEDEIRSSSSQEQVRRILEQYTATHRGQELRVVAPQQQIVFQSPDAMTSQTAKARPAVESKSGPRSATSVHKDGVQGRAVTDVVTSPIGPLTIQLSRSMQREQSEAWDFAVYLLSTLPMVVLAAFGVGYLVSSRALTPVDKMISAANDITVKRLDQRIDVPDTGDELARLARTLNEMIDRLYKSFEEMRRFTADAAHDLRTPIAALRCAVEVSLISDHTVEEYRNSMQTVLDEAVHLSRLTGQLLDLSREDHGVHSSHKEPVRLDLILHNALDDLKTVARQKQITVDTRQIRPWTVSGDQVRLHRVFMNLLDNALQYTPRGGRVSIEAQCSPEWTTIVIADNGPGIPADDLPYVFDRFRRVDQARNRELGGTGLGLAICKSIVEAHGGQIRMDSTPGQGTRVTVMLPTAKAIPISSVA
jgi:two-component system heavy metal sensor histidine kinase CusS